MLLPIVKRKYRNLDGVVEKSPGAKPALALGSERELESSTNADARVETGEIRLDAVGSQTEDPRDLGSGPRLEHEADHVTLAARQMDHSRIRSRAPRHFLPSMSHDAHSSRPATPRNLGRSDRAPE